MSSCIISCVPSLYNINPLVDKWGFQTHVHTIIVSPRVWRTDLAGHLKLTYTIDRILVTSIDKILNIGPTNTATRSYILYVNPDSCSIISKAGFPENHPADSVPIVLYVNSASS